MMLSGLSTYIKYGNIYCGIEHTSEVSDSNIIVSVLKRKKHELVVADSFSLGSPEELLKKLPKNQHLSLVFNNEHVLSKWVDFNNDDLIKAAHKAFPNINSNDFYIEALQIGKRALVAVCRRSYVDALIEEYRKLNFYVIDFHLGNFVINSVAQFTTNQFLYTSNSKVTINNSQVKSIEKNGEINHDSSFKLNGLVANARNLLSIAAALHCFLHNSISVSNAPHVKYRLAKGYQQQRLFSVAFKSVLGLIFTSLLINFFVFNHYYKNVNSLHQELQVSASSQSLLTNLNDRVTKKEKLVTDILHSSSTKSTFYIDEIIREMPSSISLMELNFSPLQKRIKEHQAVLVNKELIILSGVISNNDQFTDWLVQIEQKKWVNSIVVTELSNSNKKNRYRFGLKIKINE